MTVDFSSPVLLFVGRCWLVVRRWLFVVRRSMFVVRCSLFVVVFKVVVVVRCRCRLSVFFGCTLEHRQHQTNIHNSQQHSNAAQQQCNQSPLTGEG